MSMLGGSFKKAVLWCGSLAGRILIDPGLNQSGQYVFLFAALIFATDNLWQSVSYSYILYIACGVLFHVRTSPEFAGVVGMIAVLFMFIAVNLRRYSRSVFLFTFYEWNVNFWSLSSYKFLFMSFCFFSSLISISHQIHIYWHIDVVLSCHVEILIICLLASKKKFSFFLSSQ